MTDPWPLPRAEVAAARNVPHVARASACADFVHTNAASSGWDPAKQMSNIFRYQSETSLLDRLSRAGSARDTALGVVPTALRKARLKLACDENPVGIGDLDQGPVTGHQQPLGEVEALATDIFVRRMCRLPP